ncbi:MAG TPA: hypothetical protein VGF45_05375 [Polyangia bacterium]
MVHEPASDMGGGYGGKIMSATARHWLAVCAAGLALAQGACGGSRESRLLPEGLPTTVPAAMPSTDTSPPAIDAGTVDSPPDVTLEPDECARVRDNRPMSYDDEDFFGKLLFGIHVTYRNFATVQALADGAERVFVGRMVAVEQGNLYGNTASDRGGALCARTTTHTTNLVFEVERDIRGTGPRRVRVEQFTSRFVFSAELAPFMPTQRMLVFVEDATKYPHKGAAPGAYDQPLFLFYSPLGLITEIDGALAFPLERWGHPTPPFPVGTLDELAGFLERPAASPTP